MAKSAKWEGPIQIGSVGINHLRPSEKAGLYVISKSYWNGLPDTDAGILYVGQSNTLRRRIGEIVSVLLGFGPSPDMRYSHGKSRRIFHEECNSDIVES